MNMNHVFPALVAALLIASPMAFLASAESTSDAYDAAKQSLEGALQDEPGSELPGASEVSDAINAGTMFCPQPVGLATDPVYDALCILAAATHANLDAISAGSVTIVTEDHDDDDGTDEVPVDADDDGRADLAAVAVGLPYAVREPASSAGDDSDCYLDDSGDVPEGELRGCIDEEGRTELIEVFLQLDYFYTDDDPATPDEWYAVAPGGSFDIAVDGVMVYDPESGAMETAEPTTRLAVMNDFRGVYDVALYTPDSVGSGVCITCIDAETNSILYDGDADLGEGLLDLDIPAFDGTMSEDSIDEAIDHDGDGTRDATATLLFLRRGASAAGPTEDLRAETTGAYADRAGIDLSEIHLKFPQDPGEPMPDLRYSAYSNIDNDDSLDIEELNCEGLQSNPTNPFSDCDDIDGDGLDNANDPAPYSPLILDIKSGGSGLAPLTTTFEYYCPTDVTYQLKIGDANHDGKSTGETLTSASDLTCGAGIQTLDVTYLNADTTDRTVDLVFQPQGGGNGITQQVTVTGSQAPTATLVVTDDGTPGPVDVTITYNCDGLANGVESAVLDLGKRTTADSGSHKITLSAADCDGTDKTLTETYDYTSAKRDTNRVVPISLTVVSNAHPDLETEVTDDVIVGAQPAPTLSMAILPDSGEAPFTPTVDVTYTCAPVGSDVVTGATLSFGYKTVDGTVPGDQITATCDDTEQTASFPGAFLNDKGSDRTITAKLSVTTQYAGGPYTVTDQSVTVLGNDVEPGTFTVACTYDVDGTATACPADLSSDPQPGVTDAYDLSVAFAPDVSPEGQSITEVVFELYHMCDHDDKSSTADIVCVDFDAVGTDVGGTYEAEFLGLDWQDTLDDDFDALQLRVVISDNGGRTGVDATEFEIAFPEDVEANAAPTIGTPTIEEDYENADGTTIALKASVNVVDEGSTGRPKGALEDDNVAAKLVYWPTDDDTATTEVSLARIETCEPTTIPDFTGEIGDIPVQECPDGEDGSTGNGEIFEGSFAVPAGTSYQYRITATDDEGASATSPDALLTDGSENQAAAAEGLAAVSGGITLAEETAADLQAQLEQAIFEDVPAAACGEGNEPSMDCLAYNIIRVCEDPASAEDPTKCQGDVVEGVVETLVGLINTACTNGGAVGDGCIDNHLQFVIGVVNDGFDEVVCASVAGGFLTDCGGDANSVPVDAGELLTNSECRPADDPSGQRPTTDECGDTEFNNPLGDLDQNDVHDTDGDGNTNEPNGQLDLVEQRVVLINPDEPGDDPDDIWDGSSGQTIHVYDSRVLFNEPQHLLTVRLGDVAGTEETERLVIQRYVGADSPSAICAYTEPQTGGTTPAVFIGREGEFRGDTHCGNVQESSNIRISQADTASDGYQGMMVWMDDDNDGVREGVEANADAAERSRDDILGFRFMQTDGLGIDVVILAGTLEYTIHAQVNDEGDLIADTSVAVYDNLASVALGEPYALVDQGAGAEVDTDEPFQQYADEYPAEAGPVTLVDENGDGQPDRLDISISEDGGDAGPIEYSDSIDLSDTDVTPAASIVAGFLGSVAEGSPELPAGYGTIDDNEDGVPEGVWMDGDGDDARAEDGSEDRYFADMTDPDALVLLAEELAAQAEDAVDEQTTTVLGIVLPNCGTESTPGQPCAHDEDRGIMAALGSPLPGMRFEIPGFGYIYL